MGRKAHTNKMKPHQRLYQLMTDVHTEADNHGKEYPEFHTAPDGWEWGQRQPRRPGLYLWRYTPKWPAWFRRVVTLPSGELGTWSNRNQQLVPLDHLVGKGGSSLWLLQNNQREPKP
jgi:hypothetical protein